MHDRREHCFQNPYHNGYADKYDDRRQGHRGYARIAVRVQSDAEEVAYRGVRRRGYGVILRQHGRGVAVVQVQQLFIVARGVNREF